MLCSCSMLHPASTVERTFLPKGRSGVRLDGVTYRPRPSQTGLQPAVRAQAKYWHLERKARSAWQGFSERDAGSLVEAPRAPLLQALAREGIWMNLTALDENALTERIRAGIPVAVFQSPEALHPQAVRVLLLTGFRESPREYLLFDADQGSLIQTADRFRTRHQNALNMTLILCPGSRTTWNRTRSETRTLAQYHEHRSEWRTAISILETLLEHQAEDSPILVRIGNAWLQEEQSTLAEQRYREAIHADETNAAAYNNLAYLLAESHPVEAERLARQAHSLHPDDPGVLDTLAYTLLQLDRPEEASAWLERSRPRLKERPVKDQLAVLSRLAQSYAQSGQDHLVRQVLDQLFALKADFQVPAGLAPHLQPHHPATR